MFIFQVTRAKQNVLAICQVVVLACDEMAAVSRHFSTSVGAIQIQRGLLYFVYLESKVGHVHKERERIRQLIAVRSCHPLFDGR